MYNVKTYLIKDGDRLQTIAQRELGDASRAIDIAILNDLDYPFIGRIGDIPIKGVKLPGDSIIIPIELEADSGDPMNQSIYAEDCDISLVSNPFSPSSTSGGELEVDLYGDLQTVSGVDSLSQDIVHRLKTEKGTLIYHPTYGSDLLMLIGTKKDSTWLQRVTIEVLKTMRSDPRVKDVSELTINSIPNGVAIDCVLVTDSTQFRFNEPIVKQEV